MQKKDKIVTEAQVEEEHACCVKQLPVFMFVYEELMLLFCNSQILKGHLEINKTQEKYLTVVRLIMHKYLFIYIYAYVHTYESKTRYTIYCEILIVIVVVILNNNTKTLVSFLYQIL